MKLILLYRITLCAAFAGYANALSKSYMFDVSCSKTPNMLAFVQASFQNALAMSQAAYAAVQPPMNQGVTDALNNLVTTTGDPNISPAQWAQMVFGPAGVNRFTTLVDNNYYLDPNDVKIYCDQTRFQQRLDGRWVDSDIDRQVTNFSCKPPPADDFVLMYTVHNPLRTDGNGNTIAGESFWQIQICPFFLQYALSPAKNLNTVLLPKILWRQFTVGLGKLIAEHTVYTPIDGLSLFDKIMLHELTHSTTDRTIETEDVVTNAGETYGWKLCLALSSYAVAVKNADTWALFGSIAWQIQQGLITGVNQDGSINKP